MNPTLTELTKRFPQLATLLSQTELKGRTGRTVGTCGFSTLNNLWVLKCLFDEVRPQKTLEIGMALGASTTLFSCLHKERNPDARRAHHAIDPFQSEHYDCCTPVFLEENNLGGITALHEMTSAMALPELVAAGHKFGLIYIDGSHLFEDTFVDFYFSSLLCEVGGYVALDDCRDAHGLKVVKFVRSNLRAFFEEVSPYDYQLGSRAIKFAKTRFSRALGQQQMVIFRKTADGSRDWNTTKLSCFWCDLPDWCD